MATGAELATAWVRIVPTMDGVQGELAKGFGAADGDIEKAGKKAGGKWGAAAKVAAVAGVAALAAGVVKVFNTGLEELKFGEQINAQTQLLVDNTGFTMAVSEINDYTLALSKVSGVSEEELQAAGNNILKFGNVSEENYQKALDSINDLAATGKDASAVSEGLGKALADPATAAGKLRRMGISLTEAQEAQIATMIEAGDVAGAQGVILDSLEGTYGGMAEAAGGTLQGNINKLNNAFENMAGDLVTAVMPAVEGLVTGLQGLIEWVSANQWVIPVLATAIGVLLVGAFIAWTASIWAATAALLANPITWIILGIVALIAAIVLLVMNWDTVVAWISEVWSGFVSWLGETFNGIATWWNELWAGIAAWVQGVWSGLVSWITGAVDGFVSWWNGLWAGVGQFFNNLWTAFLLGVQIIWTGFVNWIRSALMAYVAFWTGVWNGVSSFFSALWTGLVNGVRGIWSGFTSWLMGAINGFRSWWDGIWTGIGNAFKSVWTGIQSFIGGIWDGIVDGLRRDANNIIGIINGIISGINALIGGAGALIGINVKIPTIPGLATGGTITRAGLTLVGENGPELLTLPRGAQVNPNYDSVPETQRVVNFHNHAPMGQSPAQALRQFSNRAKGL